jgi:hypothetical protein
LTRSEPPAPKPSDPASLDSTDLAGNAVANGFGRLILEGSRLGESLLCDATSDAQC